jgi:dienelactone hydrolase
MGVEMASPDVLRKHFVLEREGRRVPGLMWSERRSGESRPLVLVSHGGGGSKESVAALAERLARECSFVVAAIDGPVHGDRQPSRRTNAAVLEDFRALWRGDSNHIDDMIDDWRYVLDYLQRFEIVADKLVGWYGLSMGTAYGIPFVASEVRIRAAVFGTWGLSYPNSRRLAEDAPNVRCPVLFQQNRDDEVFTVAGQDALFDLIGATDKRLSVYPGRHASRLERQVTDAAHFLVENLDVTRRSD